MFSNLLSLILPLFSASAPAPTTATPAVSLERILDAVEQRYNKTKTLDAVFDQSFRNKAFRRTQRSTGTVRFARPGLMEWRYQTPSPRRFVLDGTDLWIHQLDDGQVFVRRQYDGDDLKAALRFLWGDGSLRSTYNVRLLKSDKKRALLKLTPKKPVGYYRFVRLAIDLTTYRVTHSVVVDHRGNENRFAFRKARYTAKLPAKTFRFEAPAESVVTELTSAK
jgi:outer membrane lipoprotein carrier protein